MMLPLTLRLHDAQLVLHAEQGAEHIGIEGGCVALGGLLGYRARLAFGARGIDGGVDPAKASDGLVDQTAHVVLVAHIGTDEDRIGAETAELGFQCLAFGFPAAGRRRRMRHFWRRRRRWRGRCRSTRR